MERIFYKKWTATLFIVAILVLVLLLCALLVTLTQMSALNKRVEKLHALIADAREQGRMTEELLEYLQTDDYVRKWAEEHGRINKSDIEWLKQQTS